MTAPAAGTELRPYKVDIPQSELDDLAERLGRVRWPDELPGVDWSHGVPLDYVRELVDHWRTGYDWRAQEARINAHPQFVTEIDGQPVHFLHVESAEPHALPLIATHGWPMSVVEYLDLIGPLTDPRAHGADPADAFHLVIPSIPGVGFSGPTVEPGWGTQRIARAWAELMRRLGYQRYGAHGNDAGSTISPEVGRLDRERVVGIHVTQLFSFPSGDPSEFEGMSDEDMAAMAFLQDFTARGGLAYNAYQSAQPQTLAYALQDSPAGWLAWVTQLFQRWADRDYIITNAAIYWLTNTVGSSIRRYYEEARTEPPGEPTSTPTGVAIFAEDFQSVRRFADRDTKKLGKFEQPGHAITGDRRQRSRRVGWEYVHSIVDDCWRLAYSEIHDDEKAATVTAFTERALDFFLELGVVAERLMTDNAFAYIHNRTLRAMLAARAIRHLRTRPYTPRTNGKVERYQQTLQREWAYALEYASSHARRASLPHWLRHYNERRTHSALGNRPPIERVREVTGLDS